MVRRLCTYVLQFFAPQQDDDTVALVQKGRDVEMGALKYSNNSISALPPQW